MGIQDEKSHFMAIPSHMSRFMHIHLKSPFKYLLAEPSLPS